MLPGARDRRLGEASTSHALPEGRGRKSPGSSAPPEHQEQGRPELGLGGGKAPEGWACPQAWFSRTSSGLSSDR